MTIIVLLAVIAIALCVLCRRGRINNLDRTKYEQRGLFVMRKK